MPMPPDVRIAELLTHVSLRLRWQALARAATAGAAAALLPFVITRHWPLAVAVVGVVAGAYFWYTRRARQHPSALVEARLPECRNVLITASALLDRRLEAKPDVMAVVLDDAARRVANINPAALWPWLRPALGLGVVAALWVVAITMPLARIAALVPGTVAAATTLSVSHVEILVTPPAYSGRAPETFSNAERITALTGSRARVMITASASTVLVETESGRQPAAVAADGRFVAEVDITTDGYVAITPGSDDGRTGARRLIGVTALPDRAPEVRVLEPGKDLFLREATARLTVRLQAEDDLGLRSLRLAYTKVAGAGESFTFAEGEVPVTMTRTSDRQWNATGVLPLDTMSLDIGDMVVYRGVAMDGRPGAAPVESDAFIVEIVSDSQAMAEGFSIDEQQDKYALSQQMVIIKTERLIAKASSMSKEAVIDEAMGLAAEQRSVRAEIVFMMGGEFEDEEVEAAHETELIEGRAVNSGRADLSRATRAMSRAAAQLTETDLKTALATERAALADMQRALSRRRFILRTLTQRGQIDDTRRLQGRLVGMGRGERPVDAAAESGLVTAARAALQVVFTVSRASVLTASHASQLSAAAAGLLTTEGRGATIVDAASRLSTASEAIVAGTPDVARRALADAITRLTAMVSAEVTAAPLTDADPAMARLRGALADALRAGGGR